MSTSKEYEIKGRILDGFRREPDRHISGEEISEKLGFSRASVWKYISGLREDGYEVQAVPHLGYRLAYSPDKLYPYEISPGIKTRVFGKKSIHYYDSVDSTNDEAYRIAEEGAPEGAIVVAESQARGKGRMGRRWSSPSGGGIYLSMVLRPDLELDEMPSITLVAALSVIQALREACGIDAMMKWPNDVHVRSGKICGILTEIKAQPDLVDFLVLGLGINVNVPLSRLPGSATSVKEQLGGPFSRVDIVRTFLKIFEDNYRLFGKHGFAAMREACLEVSTVLGRDVVVEEHHKVIRGTAEDIDEKGALIVRSGSGDLCRIFSGDVKIGPR